MFQLKQCKKKIAYNFAYIQTKTLHFTFTWQAVIVNFDAEC